MAVGGSSVVLEQKANEGSVAPAIEADLDEVLRNTVPVYRMLPEDHVLIKHYLRRKVEKQPLLYNKIHEVNIYMHSPSELASKYKPWGQGNWYFFTTRYRKYKNGTRPRRTAGNGYWKATGGDKAITDHKGEVVGYKKVLVYYQGKSKGGKSGGGVNTKWVMNEYRVGTPSGVVYQEDLFLLDKCVLCKIYQKAEPGDANSEAQEDKTKTNRRRQKTIPRNQKTKAKGIQSGIADNTHESIAVSMAQAQGNAVPMVPPPMHTEVPAVHHFVPYNFPTPGMLVEVPVNPMIPSVREGTCLEDVDGLGQGMNFPFTENVNLYDPAFDETVVFNDPDYLDYTYPGNFHEGFQDN